MRISGGLLKGRKVASKKYFLSREKGDELRPTSAKVREAVFNILQSEISGAVFIDLYAGTGAVGIEALSRGASEIILVESNPVRAQFIRSYIRDINAFQKITLHKEKVEYFLKRAASSGCKFDIIFADPPYASDEIKSVMNFIDEKALIKENGSLIIEHSSKIDLPHIMTSFILTKKYKYGDTRLSLYRTEK